MIMSAVYFCCPYFTPNDTLEFITFDGSIKVSIKTYKNGTISIQEIIFKEKKYEVHPMDIIQLVYDCFEHSIFENVKAINFKINSVPFHCTRDNVINKEVLLKHYHDNQNAKSPKTYGV